MNAQGKKLLKVAGMLEVLFGIGIILMLLFVLSGSNVAVLKSLGLSGEAQTFFNLFMAYAQAFINIIAGVLGLILADKPKHYKVNYFFGLVLILLVVFNMRNKELTSIQVLISETFALLVPALYFYGAMKNQQSL